MNHELDPDAIVSIYEKFTDGEITSEEANKLLSVFTEMKSKEEYHKRKLLGDKNTKSYFNIDYNKDTESNYVAKAVNDAKKTLKISDSDLRPKSSVEAIAMGRDPLSASKAKIYAEMIKSKALPNAREAKQKDDNNKYGFHHKGLINIGKDDNGNDIKARVQISKHATAHNKPNGYEYININKDDLRKNTAKELNTKLSHEIGHHSKNPIPIPKRVNDLIDEILGKGEEKVIKGNKHTNKSELIADYRAVKRVGKEDALKLLYKSVKDAHRNSGENTHEGIDQDIKLRAKFIKSLNKEDLE